MNKKRISLKQAMTQIIANSAEASRAMPEVHQAVDRVIKHMEMEIGYIKGIIEERHKQVDQEILDIVAEENQTTTQ